jgi:hypothetical protein
MTQNIEGSKPFVHSVNQQLAKDSTQLLGEALKKDKNTETNTRTIPNDDKNNIIKGIQSDKDWLSEYSKRLCEQTSPIIWEYHKSEIENVEKIIRFSLWIFTGVTISTFLLVILCIVLDKNYSAVITGVVGAVTDAILTIIIGMFNSTLKSKKSYFDAESSSIALNKMLLTLQSISNNEKKDDIIVNILNKFFEIESTDK